MRVFLILLLFITGHLYANEFTEGRDKNSVEAVQSLEAYAKYKMGQYEEAREISVSYTHLTLPTSDLV